MTVINSAKEVRLSPMFVYLFLCKQDNRPAELCRQRTDRLEQFTSCSASTWQIIGGVQASSENIRVWTL